MDSYLIICSAALAVGAGVRGLKLWRVTREERPMIRAMCGLWLTRAVILLALAPTAASAIDRHVHVAGFSFVIALLFCVATAACAQKIFHLIEGTRPVWTPAGRCALVGAYLLVALLAFLVVHRPEQVSATGFLGVYARTPYLAVSLTVYFAVSFVVAMYISLRWHYWLRGQLGQVGMSRVVRIHAGINLVFIGLGWSGVSLAVVVARWWFAADVGRWPEIAILSAATGSLLILVGNNLAAWAPRVLAMATRIGRNWRDLRDHRRLRPLWLHLRPVAPEMVHVPSSWAERLSPRSRLFWRVIEINDWLHQSSAGSGPGTGGVLPVRGGSPVRRRDDLPPDETGQVQFVFADERALLLETARSLKGTRRRVLFKGGWKKVDHSRG